MVEIPGGFTATAPKQPAYECENPRTAFMDEMSSYGFEERVGKKLPPVPEIGRVVRIAAPDDKKGRQSGWYWFGEFSDDFKPGALIGVGVFGSWKGNPERVVWTSKRKDSMSPAEQARLDEQMKAAKIARDMAIEATRKEAATLAQNIWNDSPDAPADHPYFQAKGIQPHGTRLSGERIVVPVMEKDEIVSLQFVGANGEKKFLTGGKTGGCHFTIGEPSETVYVAEGFATAATIHEATGDLCYVAYNAGNLMEVVGAAKDRNPESQIVIAGDDDHLTDGNPGRAKADAAGDVQRCKVVYPEVEGGDTDFNDMARRQGIEAVSECLIRGDISAKSKFKPYTYPPDFDPAAIPERAWIIPGLLLRGYVTMGIAPAGTGKSVFAMVAAIMVAVGKPLLKRELREQTNVLVLNNEDDQDEIDRRVAGICQRYEIAFGALTGKLFMLSGYGSPHIFAQQNDNGTVAATRTTAKLIEFCNKNQIGLIIADPFVSTHDVPENDNTEIEKVMTVYRSIARDTGAAMFAIHHTGKNHTEYSEAHAGNQDAGRGASSLTGAVRINFTLARMSRKTADSLDIDWSLGNRLVRLDDGKVNFALKSEKEEWYELESHRLANGDSVGVPVPYDMSSIAKLKEQKRDEEKTKQNEIKVTEIAKVVASLMTEDKQPQPEALSAYQVHTGKKKTASSEAISMLPVGLENATRIVVDGVTTKVWRERQGNENRPYYTIHKVTER